jgi:tetratricopeptide (TPR) repeat protein
MTGQLDKALPLFEDLLARMKTQLGPDHPHTLTTMNHLAETYRDADQIDKALPLLEEAIKLRQTTLGLHHPDTLRSMALLASDYEAAGQLDKALPLREEILKLQTEKLGSEHPDTLASTTDLASTYTSAGQFDKSIPLHEGVLKLQEKTLGRQNPETLKTVAHLGANYLSAGRVAEAIPLLEEANQAEQANLRWVGTKLFVAYQQVGKSAEATAVVKAQIASARQQLPQGSLQLAGTLMTIASSLLDAREFATAEPLVREALAIAEKQAPNSWLTFNTQSLLGAALLGQKKYADAEPHLLAGYQGIQQRAAKIPRKSQVPLAEALDLLIELYTATEKPAEVQKWQAERAKYPPRADR